MMVKTSSMVYKTLVVVIIVIFIGVGIQPAYTVNVSNHISDSEDDCNLCPKVREQHLVLIKSLLNKTENYDSQLSVLSNPNHELDDIYQDFFYRILEQNQLVRNYEQNKSNGRESICNLLWFHIWNLAVRDVFFTNLGDNIIYTNPILGVISYFLAYMYYFRILTIGAFGLIIGCFDYWFENY